MPIPASEIDWSLVAPDEYNRPLRYGEKTGPRELAKALGLPLPPLPMSKARANGTSGSV